MESYSRMLPSILGFDLDTTRMKKRSVRHQQTCPICRRQNVNVYCRNTVWRCKKCWDKHYEFVKMVEEVKDYCLEKKYTNLEGRKENE
jgi:ribosomal protein L37AE/L43A